MYLISTVCVPPGYNSKSYGTILSDSNRSKLKKCIESAVEPSFLKTIAFFFVAFTATNPRFMKGSKTMTAFGFDDIVIEWVNKIYSNATSVLNSPLSIC